jgi:hypothetical protein
MEREVQQSDLDRQKSEYDRAWEGKGLTVPGKKPAKPSAPYAAPKVPARSLRRATFTPATNEALALHAELNPEPQVDPSSRGMGEHGEWMRSQEAVHRNPEVYLANNGRVRPAALPASRSKTAELASQALALHDKLNKKPVVRDVTASQPHDLERQGQVDALNNWHDNRDKANNYPAEYIAENAKGPDKLTETSPTTPFAPRTRQSVSAKRLAAFRGEA